MRHDRNFSRHFNPRLHNPHIPLLAFRALLASGAVRIRRSMKDQLLEWFRMPLAP